MIALPSHHEAPLTQLGRVLTSRVFSAEQQLSQELAGLLKIEKEIAERQSKVTALEQQIKQLQSYFYGQGVDERHRLSAADYQLGLNHRRWIEYDLERERYYLNLTFDELKEQQVKVHEVRQKLKILTCKQQVLDAHFKRTQIRRRLQRERHYESADQPASVVTRINGSVV